MHSPLSNAGARGAKPAGHRRVGVTTISTAVITVDRTHTHVTLTITDEATGTVVAGDYLIAEVRGLLTALDDARHIAHARGAGSAGCRVFRTHGQVESIQIRGGGGSITISNPSPAEAGMLVAILEAAVSTPATAREVSNA